MQSDKKIPFVPDDFVDALRASRQADDVFNLTHSTVDEDAFYDFVSHQLFFDPDRLKKRLEAEIDDRAELRIVPMVEAHLLGDLEISPTSEIGKRIMQEFLPWGIRIYSFALKIGQDYLWREDWESDEEFADLVGLGAADWMLWWWYVLGQFDWDTIDAFVNILLQRIELSGYHSWRNPPLEGVVGLQEYQGALLIDPRDLEERLRELYEGHLDKIEGNPYFDPVLQQSVNFGLRIVYRQQWQCIGNQYGDIIRTIPLGPKQVQRVSLRHMRRNKVTRAMETTSSLETSAESTLTLKDSSEIVEEASKSLKLYFDQETKGGFDCGLWDIGGTTSFGANEQSNNLSRATKSKISESMQRAASKARQETKITVSMEQESEFERESSAELVNPNDEVAVTYVYQKLLKQYLTNTYLAEVESVVFIAERVPSHLEVTDEWIRKNASAIRAALIEPSLSEALDLIVSSQSDADGPSVASGYTDEFKTALQASASALGLATAGNTTLNFEGAVNAYRQVVAEARGYKAQNEANKLQKQRLRQHICDNILRYMRSIWAREDLESRMWRHRRILVPTSFHFVVDENQDTELATENSAQVQGHWAFDPDLAKWKTAADIIDPVGPIGFYGNYAVYQLSPKWAMTKLNELFEYHKLVFSSPPAFIVNRLEGNESIQLNAEAGYAHRIRYGTYFVKVEKPAALGMAGAPTVVEVCRVISPTSRELVSVEKLDTPSGETGEYFLADDAFVLTLSYVSGLGAGASTVRPSELGVEGYFRIDVLAPEIRDPELDEIELRYPLISGPGSEQAQAARFTDTFVEEMFKYLPGLRTMWTEAAAEVAGGELDDGSADEDESEIKTIWGQSTPLQKSVLRRYYHEYLLRKKHSRFIVVDTNNVVVNLHTGTGSALEPFKRAHRYLDVAKAALEINRRDQMLENEDRSDPEVDRMIVVHSDRNDSDEVATVTAVTPD